MHYENTIQLQQNILLFEKKNHKAVLIMISEGIRRVVLMTPAEVVEVVGRQKDNIQKINKICKYNHYLRTT